MLNQNPILYTNRDQDYRLSASVTKGENLIITIKNLPSNAAQPYQYQWDMREVPSPVNGIINYQSGTLIQSNSGVLPNVTASEVVITAGLPLSANQFVLGKPFSFTLKVNQPSQASIVCVEGLFLVGSVASVDSSNPLVDPTVTYNDTNTALTVLNSTQVGLINGAGLDLTTLPGGGTPSQTKKWSWFFHKNGQLLASDEYIITGNLFKVASSDSNFELGDAFTYRFILQ